MAIPHQRYESSGPTRLTHDMVRYLIGLKFGPFNLVHLVALLPHGWPVRGGQA